MMGLNLNEQGLVRQSLVRIAFSFGSKCYRNFLFRRIVWNRTLRLRQLFASLQEEYADPSRIEQHENALLKKMIQDPNKEKESQITSMKAATESDAKEKEPVMKPITESTTGSQQTTEKKTEIYSRENLNSYIQLQTTRKLSIFYGDLPEMHRGRERTSYIPFLLNLERRLDVILVRLHFCETIPQARQLISHRRVCVNNRMVSITHLKVSHGDIISFQENDARIRGEEIRRSFYIEILVDKIIGKFLDHPVRRRTKTEWFHLLKTKRGCRLLLKSPFLQRLRSSMQEEDLKRRKKFGFEKVCLGSSFAEHNRMKRNLYHFKSLFFEKKRNEKNRNLPTRIRSPIVYNYSLYSNSIYCSASPQKWTMKRRIKRIELPTHYVEVNYRTLKAVVSYGPNIGYGPIQNLDLRNPFEIKGGSVQEIKSYINDRSFEGPENAMRGLVHRYNLCNLMVYPWIGQFPFVRLQLLNRRSTPANSLAHSLLLLWGPEAQGDFTRWCQLGGLWTFVALHGAFGLIGFMLRQFELARSVQLRPYNAIAFSAPIAVFVSVFLIYPLGQSGWFFAPSFGVAAIFRFILFFQGFHNWTLNPFHMMGVAGVLGAALLCAIHGATVEKTLFEDGDGANTFRAFNPTQAEETYSMVTANRFWSQIFGVAFSNKRWLHFFMLFVPVTGLWMSALGVVGWEVGPGGEVIDTFPYFVSGVLHLISSAVLGFGGEGWIVSVDDLEDIIGGHVWLGSICILGGICHILTKPFAWARRALVWSGEAYLSYSLGALSAFGFIACCFVWFNNTAYPSEFYGPTGPEASQAFTFLVRDQRLGANVGGAKGPTGLGKYLMRSPTREVLYWRRNYAFLGFARSPLRGPNGLDLRRLKKDIQPWQERRSAYDPCAFRFIKFRHLWHAGRARAAAFEKGIDRDFEPVGAITDSITPETFTATITLRTVKFRAIPKPKVHPSCQKIYVRIRDEECLKSRLFLSTLQRAPSIPQVPHRLDAIFMKENAPKASALYKIGCCQICLIAVTLFTFSQKSGIQIQLRQEHVREQGAERPSTSIASTADSIAISSKP
ncbi:hypothetical protein DKX38_030070 (mitochondrion) [Salix brachista]|uniref:RNA-binding S4 domain-containing protein n=1 Tax=Salix brachista TaxID=2182728 RepID=A0A5N5J0B3_9ROSI|nr:hypothetical protein DKX38_030070 [Salix brachista]